MTLDTNSIRVAVIGTSLAGAACAAGLQRAGAQVTLFEKSQTVGGRTAAQRVSWIDASGAGQSVTFDNNAQCITPLRPRFRALMARAMSAGGLSEWRPRVHTVWPVEAGQCLVATPAISAMCHHLLAGATVHLNRTVRRLQRAPDGGWYVAADGMPLAGPFHHIALAIPPAQAAVLMAGHQDSWADALMARRMTPCWTLMAVTDDADWPWDVAEPARGPLSWVLRNDRMPGHTMPPGLAVWTAHATAEWSAVHLEDEPQAVNDELQSALRAQLPTASGGRSIRWHHTNVHRWHHAGPAVNCDDSLGSGECRWDESLGLGFCGDFFEDGSVEAAWHSGDELADCMAASFERTQAPGCHGDVLDARSRKTSATHPPVIGPSALIYQASRALVSPVQSETRQVAGARLKVSHRIPVSNR